MQLRYNIQLGRQQMCLVLKQCLLLATVVAYIFPALKKAYPSNRTIQTRVANFFRSFFSILIRSRPLDVTTTAIRMSKMSWQCITFYLYVYWHCKTLNHLYTLSCHVCCCSGSNPHFLECKTPPRINIIFPSWRCGGLVVWALPLDHPSRVRISARSLPTVWSEGRQITL